MRESTHFPGDYTLCLKSESKIENYHIKRINSVFTIDDDRTFPTLIKLIQVSCCGFFIQKKLSKNL
jgi:hypothetical protein